MISPDLSLNCEVMQGSSCTVSDFPSALLDLVTCWNITFAPVLTSVVLVFNSHPTTLKHFRFKCHRRMNHCLTLRCVIHLFRVGRSPLCYRRLSFTADIFSHTCYILQELLWKHQVPVAVISCLSDIVVRVENFFF